MGTPTKTSKPQGTSTGTLPPVKGPIVAALNFDPHADAVLATAVGLARRFGLPLRLVHVAPSQVEMAAWDYSATLYHDPGYLAAIDAEVAAQAATRLAEVAATVPRDIAVTTAVPVGPAVPGIIAEATGSRANMIVVACAPERFTTVTAGFSTAIGLMHEAPLPVLVVNRERKFDVEKSALRLLLADDLQAPTAEAARVCYALAARLGTNTQVRHSHIHGDFRELVKDNWREFRAFAQFLPEPTVPPEEAMRREYDDRIARLKDRGQPWRSLAQEAGATTVYDVRTGSVAGEIHHVVDEFDPDLVVFGRHRLLRTKPFLIGRMPFRTMLNDRRPVLLVPSRQELYTRLSFPG